jgi:hypothetical protein
LESEACLNNVQNSFRSSKKTALHHYKDQLVNAVAVSYEHHAKHTVLVFPIQLRALLGVGNFTKVVRMCVDRL